MSGFIGKNIKKTRDKLHLTQKEVQDSTGIDVVNISRYENGHKIPNVETLLKFCNVFKCNICELVYGSKDDEKNFK